MISKGYFPYNNIDLHLNVLLRPELSKEQLKAINQIIIQAKTSNIKKTTKTYRY